MTHEFCYYKWQIWIMLLLVLGQPLLGQNKPTGSSRAAATPVTPPGAYGATTVNYIRGWEPNMPTSDPTAVISSTSISAVKQTTQYFDGLGRPLQIVNKGVSPTGKDMVTPMTYDIYGREQYKYLPYAATTGNSSDGKFKVDPFNAQKSFYQDTTLNPGISGEKIYYSQIDYEASLLNRVRKTYAPGNNWAATGGNRPQAVDDQVNTTADAVRVWEMPATGLIPVSSRTYGQGQLYKNITTDERGYRTIVFKDKQDRTLLKKAELSIGAADGHNNWLCTYYVYDDLGNMRCLIPPKGVELIKSTWVVSADVASELCYFYRYDGDNRVIVKKLPGADSTEMVYDTRDRLVFKRDGNLKTGSPAQWLAYFYDELNRPIMTALYKSGATRESLQSTMNTATPNVQNLAYTFPGTDDLVVATHDRPQYVATKSVTLEGGFDTQVSGTMEAFIDPLSNRGTTTITATNAYPAIPPGDLTPLAYTFYNNYSFAGAQAALISDLGKPKAGNNLYSEPGSSTSSLTKGLITGTKIRVLGTEKWLTTTTYYTDKGRIAQVISDNIEGGQDVFTNLYDFSGKVLSTYLRHKNPKSGTTPQTTVLTMMAYDGSGKLTQVTKQLNDNVSRMDTIATITYDELGNIKNKVLGKKSNGSMETLNYQYNIRGWLNGINKSFVNATGSGTNWFGQEINYDDGFASNQYNGNIAGVKWKSKGDGIARAYGYGYDPANRILKADFTQNEAGVWGNTKVDFSVKLGDGINPVTAYDGNGNILSLTQKGLKGTASTTIDQLTYSYMQSGVSNRLQGIVDAVNDPSSTLGDFKEINGTGANDYTFDLNGNLKSDYNKKITAISYNHLNLPQAITITSKGTIQYLYDATGNKLQKIITDNTVTPARVTTTDYIGGFTYQNDTLQFLGHEEGRVRLVYNTGSTPQFVYDYFIKDQLGNVRMVLSEQTGAAIYAATMETANQAKENALFSNIDNTRVPKPAGYPSDGSDANKAVAKLTALNGGKKIGPSLVLRVMAGDTIQIGAKAFYKSTGIQDKNSPEATVENMVADLLQAFAGNSLVEGTHGAGIPGGQTPFNADFYNNDYQRLKDKDPDEHKVNKPKAYLNFVLFDDQFKLVDENSGVKQVKAEPDQLQTLTQERMPIKKSGFLYVYTSNESPQEVFFDDVIVMDMPGPLTEETHYYPFGLTMAGISSNALKGTGYPDNLKEYNGIEHTTDLDLNLYDAFFRTLDPQIGRWNQIDPKTEAMEEWSPYASNYDNPIRFNDYLGDFSIGQPTNNDKRTFGFNSIVEGFTSYFANISNAVANPAQTAKNMAKPVNIAKGAINAVTMGSLSTAESLTENVNLIANEGLNGLGKILGKTLAELTVFAVTEGAAKGISAIKAATKVNPFAGAAGSAPVGKIGESLTKAELLKKNPGVKILEQVEIKFGQGPKMRADFVLVDEEKILGSVESKVNKSNLSAGQKSLHEEGQTGVLSGKNAGAYAGQTISSSSVPVQIYRWDTRTGTFKIE